MDTIQIILVVVVVALTLLLFVVGVQVVMILTDLRKSVKRLNSILEDSIWGGGLIRPEKLTGIFEMIKKKKGNEVSQKGSAEEKSSFGPK
ncbi:hypothetical protein IPM62_06435 [Candidatus Woesebacteria bacterium]|nr:MAG: hypothetical protein IPM62_06435 [Candidatus Woesebacteria bacterium]